MSSLKNENKNHLFGNHDLFWLYIRKWFQQIKWRLHSFWIKMLYTSNSKWEKRKEIGSIHVCSYVVSTGNAADLYSKYAYLHKKNNQHYFVYKRNFVSGPGVKILLVKASVVSLSIIKSATYKFFAWRSSGSCPFGR